MPIRSEKAEADKMKAQIDIRLTKRGRVTMTLKTFGLLIGRLPYPVAPSIQKRLRYKLLRKAERIYIEGFNL